MPNFVPAKHASYADKIVVAKATGTTVDASVLLPSDSLYVDWFTANTGGTWAGGANLHFYLYVDGVFRTSWLLTTPWPGDGTQLMYVTDVPVGTLPAGVHTVQIVVDPLNVVAESNETDNSYTKTFVVGGSGYVEPFDGGPGSWSLGGLWHATTACAAALGGHSASTTLYFGVDASCNYDNGAAVSGTLESPWINLLTASGPQTFAFSSYLQTENIAGFDLATVSYSFDGSTWTVLDRDETNGGTLGDDGVWTRVTYSVDDWAGKWVKIRFTFNSVDAMSNAYQGWHLDDVAVYAAPGSQATKFYKLTPCRVLDTRTEGGGGAGLPLQAGETRTTAFVSKCGIPSEAKALAASLTVTSPTAGGFVTLYPGPGSRPNTSSISFDTAKTRSNSMMLALTGGMLSVYNGQTIGTVQVIVDVNGYFK